MHSGLYRHGCLDANLHPRSRQLRRSGTYATFRVQPGAEHTHRSSNAACIYPVDKFRDSNYGVEPNSRALLTLDGVTNPSVAAPTTPALTPTTPSRGLPFRDSSSSRYVHHVHALPGRALYRPPGIPVLVGSGSYSPTQQGIPTHRYGGPALLRHTTASNVHTRVQQLRFSWRHIHSGTQHTAHGPITRRAPISPTPEARASLNGWIRAHRF